MRSSRWLISFTAALRTEKVPVYLQLSSGNKAVWSCVCRVLTRQDYSSRSSKIVSSSSCRKSHVESIHTLIYNTRIMHRISDDVKHRHVQRMPVCYPPLRALKTQHRAATLHKMLSHLYKSSRMLI